MNGYIPDCTNIGTTFVNAIANMLATAAYNIKVKVEHYEKLELGSIRYGQPLEYLVYLTKLQAYNIKQLKLSYEAQG